MEAIKQARVNDISGGSSWEMWGIPLFGRGMEEALKLVEEKCLKIEKKPYWIATVNTEFVMEARKDARFLNLLQKTDLNVVDGIGLIWGKKIQNLKSKIQKITKGFWVGVEILRGQHREGLVPGVDMVDRMCRLAEMKGLSVYFYGGWNDRSEKTAKYFAKKYPKLKIVGYRAEDFDFETRTDFLFVARAMKRQEFWIEDNFDKLRAKVVVGVGRTFDYYSKALPRAPKWIQKMGLEWLYALYKQPERWRRQLALPKFIWRVIWG
jgi:N-acetylglucosaminyldiphosphoundecaprenol N-acetyl-beta-D-mannosaminyltransferase